MCASIAQGTYFIRILLKIYLVGIPHKDALYLLQLPRACWFTDRGRLREDLVKGRLWTLFAYTTVIL